ncbi:hypothetical protein TNCV_1979591 [Trichonephila clavipes]|nr:hypothetical protein TNCV_1979591 [Trichonephila clavipes]
MLNKEFPRTYLVIIDIQVIYCVQLCLPHKCGKQLIGLEINTFQDLKDLMVVDQLKKRANASMKDPVLDNWANLKSATQIAELFDNYEDVRKVHSKLMDRLGRNDKILTYSGVKEKENRFGKTFPRLGASVPESTRENF